MTKQQTVHVYNPQWGRNMDVSKRFHDHMASRFFAPSHTGGGCMAWERILDDGGWVWVTYNDSLGSWEERDEAVWLVGRYSADGDSWITVQPSTLADALGAATRIPDPQGRNDIDVSPVTFQEQE
jgi:hypothetical protein